MKKASFFYALISTCHDVLKGNVVCMLLRSVESVQRGYSELQLNYVTIHTKPSSSTSNQSQGQHQHPKSNTSFCVPVRSETIANPQKLTVWVICHTGQTVMYIAKILKY